MRGTFSVGRVLGIPILVNPSWFASLFLIVGILSLQVFPGVFPRRETGLYWLLGLGGGIVFFVSIVLHELGHCLVARHYAIPVKSITLFIFGGVSQITREAPRPRAELLMAVAGPAVSLVLGGLLLALRLFVLTEETPLALLCEWLGEINVVLAAFNLLPGFPMDGGRVLRALLWGISGNFRTATRLAAWLGRGLAIMMIAAGVVTLLSLPGWPLSQDPIEGLWLIFVGLFLNNAAGQTQRQARLLDFLRSYRADQLMQADVPAVPAEATVRSFVFDLPNGPDEVACFVTREGRVAGLLPRDRLRQIPAAQWGTVTAADLMIPADRISPAGPEEDGATLLQRMDTQGLPGLPVVSEGAVTGLVTRAALFRLLNRNPRFRLSGL